MKRNQDIGTPEICIMAALAAIFQNGASNICFLILLSDKEGLAGKYVAQMRQLKQFLPVEKIL